MEDHLRIKLKNAGRHFKRPKMLIIWKRKENSERVGASSKQRRTILWQQSRVNWLQYGDCNTTNFHSKAIHKKQTNLIKCLQSSASHIATTENQMDRSYRCRNLHCNQATRSLESFWPGLQAGFFKDHWSLISKDTLILIHQLLAGSINN